ncbi:MAG: cation:proton antiporter [Sandaracinaceae bacterium]|nr:cation:proton antiporter [Sandaracinaceae bacterium]
MQADTSETLLLIGLLLLCAVATARLAARVRLPAITGHLLAGLGVGALFRAEVSTSEPFLSTVKLGAGAVVLFWIGAQVSVARVRLHARAMTSSAGAAVASVVACALVLFALVPSSGGSWAELVVVALVLSTTSPTVIAILTHEQGDAGPLAQVALDSAVLTNAAIALLVVVTLGFGAPGVGGLWSLAGDVAAGLAVGGAVGVLVGLGSPTIPAAMHLACAALAFFALRLELRGAEVPIVAGALLAGVVVGTSERGASVSRAVAPSMPVASAVLFAVSGVLADVSVVAAVAAPAVLIVLVRAASLWAGAKLVGVLDHDALRGRFAFAPLLPQAGFSLALATVLTATGVAGAPAALVLAVLAINELVMPPVLRRALRSPTTTPDEPAST